jgi:endonuclease YncB( thermonuclease family)
VVDTGTLQIRGQSLRLFGIEGTNGSAARELGRYIRGREAVCEPMADAYRCRINGQDLSEVILFNGGARTTAEATSELVAAEEQARAARVGVWER